MSTESSPRICAVTVCIDFSGTLAQCLRNRSLVDHWVVVTTPDDTATIELCELNGIDHLAVATRRTGFHAATNKALYLDEGIRAALELAEWVLILDADVILPFHWREVFDRSGPEPDKLYGSIGRKIVSTRGGAFHAADSGGLGNCDISEIVPGFFQLFHASTWPGSYARSVKGFLPRDPGVYDDVQFWSRFRGRERRLPLAVVHVGDTFSTWDGQRVSYSASAGPAGTEWKEKGPAGQLAETGVILVSEDLDWNDYLRDGWQVVGVYSALRVLVGIPAWWDKLCRDIRFEQRVEEARQILTPENAREWKGIYLASEVPPALLLRILRLAGTACWIGGPSWHPDRLNQATQELVAFFGAPEVLRCRSWKVALNRPASRDEETTRTLFMVVMNSREVVALRRCLGICRNLASVRLFLIDGNNGSLGLEAIAWRTGVEILRVGFRMDFDGDTRFTAGWMQWALRTSVLLGMKPGDLLVEVTDATLRHLTADALGQTAGLTVIGKFGPWCWNPAEDVWERPRHVHAPDRMELPLTSAPPRFRVMADTSLWLFADSPGELGWILGILENCVSAPERCHVGCAWTDPDPALAGRISSRARLETGVSEEDFVARMRTSAEDFAQYVAQPIEFSPGTIFGLSEEIGSCDILIAGSVWEFGDEEDPLVDLTSIPKIFAGISLWNLASLRTKAFGEPHPADVERHLANLDGSGAIEICVGFRELVT